MRKRDYLKIMLLGLVLGVVMSLVGCTSARQACEEDGGAYTKVGENIIPVTHYMKVGDVTVPITTYVYDEVYECQMP